ncbi:hypothetical protein OG21DRAFT_642042 [Imleria badia]|nr:hypothetical protein OG21DRAFT_642042 [Imleria badia]
MHCMTCSADASSAIKLLQDTPRKDDGSDLSAITIKFSWLLSHVGMSMTNVKPKIPSLRRPKLSTHSAPPPQPSRSWARQSIPAHTSRPRHRLSRLHGAFCCRGWLSLTRSWLVSHRFTRIHRWRGQLYELRTRCS